MNEAFLCDAIRTPFGRYGGWRSLSVRTDDLAAAAAQSLMARNPNVDWAAVDDVIYGCANQAGEGQPQRRRMAALLAACRGRCRRHNQPPVRLEAGRHRHRERAIKAGEADLVLAGGVRSMTRAVRHAKADSAFSRTAKIEDTTIGWRFVNPLMKAQYGIDSMPETAENVATEFGIARADQDAFALRSQMRAASRDRRRAHGAGDRSRHAARAQGRAVVFAQDEHPRATTLDALAKLKPHRAA